MSTRIRVRLLTNGELEKLLEQDRNARLKRTSRWSFVVAALLTALFGGIGEFVIGTASHGLGRSSGEQEPEPDVEPALG